MRKTISRLNNPIKNKYFGLLGLAFLVAVFSFPPILLDYGPGVDQSLKWLFNHLFSEGLTVGSNIIFPHGPLAFFMYPTADNFLLTVFVTMILQVAFVFQLNFLLNKDKWYYWLLTFALSWLIFSMSNFNQLILSNVLVGYLNYLKHGKSSYKYWALLLTSFAFYVKAYVAILTGIFTVSLLVIVFFKNRNFKQIITDAGILLGMMLLFWLMMYHQFSGFINYCIGMIHLAGDNSAGAAFHPYNNWPVIVPYLAIIILIPFLQRTKEGTYFGFLFLLSFFAAWKYGMAREDYLHLKIYLYFVAISMILFIIYNRKKLLVNTFLIAIAVYLFAVNMKTIDSPEPLRISYSGIRNFTTFLTSYSEIKEAKEKKNLEGIAIHRLPQDIRNQIGEATVDIYPYDFTILAANNLNWKPRPVIQSYVTYTSWLDKKNAGHFNSKEAPQYFIFRLNNSSHDLNGGRLESIDNRYLLNDEPQTLLELLKNYECIYGDGNFLVYRKRAEKLDITSTLTPAETGSWHQWMDVPDTDIRFKRLKLHVSRSLLGDIKSFLYKDEFYYLYLKTLDGFTFKYRIVPQNAVDGIWINPFLSSAGDHTPDKIITQLMLVCSDKNMVKDIFSYEWENINVEEKVVYDFFGKYPLEKEEVYVDDNVDMSSEKLNWHGFNAENVKEDTVTHQKYYSLEPKGYSPTLKLNTDSVTQFANRITVDCWLKAPMNSPASIIIETENAAGEKTWQGLGINRQILVQGEMNHVFNYLDSKSPVSKVGVYLWNNGDQPVLIYSMNVKMIKM